MLFAPFAISRLPRIIFGRGQIKELPLLVASYGQHILLVTGARSLRATSHWQSLIDDLQQRGITWSHLTVSGEPTPQTIDAAVAQFHSENIQVVVGIGGGSVLDAAKAIAGLLPRELEEEPHEDGDLTLGGAAPPHAGSKPHTHSVMNYLEGVGKGLTYHGPSLPFIAVPTTAGTGSEATKNSVLSVQGAEGFKKSFRNECLVPEYALLDPDLLETCPPALIAADGMDAFTQLLEAYVSSKANPLIDALAWSGIEAVHQGFLAAYQGDAEGRAAMAYAALLSGICLAQVGLGSVHGLASPLGAFFPIPHGVVCGTLVAKAIAINIAALKQRAPQHPALAKYADVGRLLAKQQGVDSDTAHRLLCHTLHEWTERLQLPRLGSFGVTAIDIPKIVANCRGNSMLTNPIVLSDDEVTQIVLARL
jgi:alcohol dehydrogenase